MTGYNHITVCAYKKAWAYWWSGSFSKSACLTRVRAWVQTPVLAKNKTKNPTRKCWVISWSPEEPADVYKQDDLLGICYNRLGLYILQQFLGLSNVLTEGWSCSRLVRCSEWPSGMDGFSCFDHWTAGSCPLKALARSFWHQEWSKECPWQMLELETGWLVTEWHKDCWHLGFWW
jgi:hypothetical protein